MKLQGIGIPFFTETEWAKAKLVMDDGHTFHDTYVEFLKQIEQAETQYRAQGVALIRISVVVDDFVAWCRQANCKVDSKARAHYAAVRAKELDQGR